MTFNMQVIDTDQMLMWIGATDFSNGHFPEPRFYGQDYNTFLEALIAVPFLWLGVPVYYAVPIATHLLTLFPFIFTACWLYKNQYFRQAVLTLALLLCMPVTFELLTALPRGFVTALPFCSFMVASVMRPQNLRYFSVNTVLAIIGLFVNPTSVIVSAPALAYVYFHHVKNVRFYKRAALCVLTLIPCFLLFDLFYVLHPDRVVLPIQGSLAWSNFKQAVQLLPDLFRHVSFISGAASIGLFTAMILLFMLSWRTDRKAIAALLVLTGVVAVSLFSDKSLAGSDWIFYSYSRIYLGMPLVICVFAAVLPTPKRVTKWVAITAMAFFGYKLYSYPATINAHADKSREVCVAITPLGDALHNISFYKEKADRHGCKTMVISLRFWLSTTLGYGGPAVHSDFPKTFVTSGDRRWQSKEAAKTLNPDRFIFISADGNTDQKLSGAFQLTRLDDYGLYLVTENKLTLAEFFALVETNAL